MKIHDPAMTFLNDDVKQKWELGVKNNQDPYGNAVYRYASEFATQMEATLTREDFKTAAKRLQFEVDDEGITGFMFGCAMSILANCWKHGEELRIWHNLETQIEANKKGIILNPAILTVK